MMNELLTLSILAQRVECFNSMCKFSALVVFDHVLLMSRHSHIILGQWLH